MKKPVWHTLSVLKEFDVCFNDGLKTEIAGWHIPVFGVPVYIDGRGYKYYRRAKKLISRATRHAEKLGSALMALEKCETDATLYFRSMAREDCGAESSSANCAQSPRHS